MKKRTGSKTAFQLEHNQRGWKEEELTKETEKEQSSEMNGKPGDCIESGKPREKKKKYFKNTELIAIDE